MTKCLSLLPGLNLPQKRNLSNFISKLPFTSNEPDATMLIERKQGLEKYLQVRCGCGLVQICRVAPGTFELSSQCKDTPPASVLWSMCCVCLCVCL